MFQCSFHIAVNKFTFFVLCTNLKKDVLDTQQDIGQIVNLINTLYLLKLKIMHVCVLML